jgi:hypothetical protein
MGINFPDTPVLNQLHPIPIAPGLPQYRWDGEKWVTAASIDMPGTVRYDTAQGLTASQKAQARSNIDCLKKNYIINGAMQVSQENGTNQGGTNIFYPVDQFWLGISGTSGVITVAQGVLATPGGSPNRIRATVTTADASVAAGDIVWLSQLVEGLRAADLRFGSASAKTITIQFGVRAPAGTYSVVVANTTTTRDYVAEYTIAAGEANTDVVKNVTIPGDTAGTWAADNTAGLVIRWGLMAGTTWQQAAGAWGTTNAIGSPNQFNFMGTVGNIFDLFDVGLYEGPVAPAFQVPDYAPELALCKRYWQRISAVVETPALYQSWALPVEMRIAPTITGGNAGFTNQTPSAASCSVSQTARAANTLSFNARL